MSKEEEVLKEFRKELRRLLKRRRRSRWFWLAWAVLVVLGVAVVVTAVIAVSNPDKLQAFSLFLEYAWKGLCAYLSEIRQAFEALIGQL